MMNFNYLYSHRRTCYAQLAGRFFVIAMMAFFAAISAARAADDSTSIKVAQEFADKLVSGKFDKATSSFDETMSTALPSDKLKAIWESLVAQGGPHQKFGTPHTGEIEGYKIVYLPTEFKKTTVTLEIVLDKSNHISGFFVLPPDSPEASASSYTPPSYDKPDTYVESDVEFGKSPWTVKGKLTVPKNTKPGAAVVLVHGSGPHDEDESIGPNKPFRDLATGLSSRGIVVLRYQKRTFAHKTEFIKQNDTTLRGEVIEDALAALSYLRTRTDVADPKRIYLLGHSLGGSLAPHIAQEDGKLAGVIILSGTPRNPFTIIREQLKYLASLPGPQKEANERIYKEARKIISKFKKGEVDGTAMLLGAPLSYWNDWKDYATLTPKAIQSLSCRFFIANGGRDYQVKKKDYDIYREALANNRSAMSYWYDDLNHLYMTGQGLATPDEYNKAGHVDAKVINDLANWLTQ